VVYVRREEYELETMNMNGDLLTTVWYSMFDYGSYNFTEKEKGENRKAKSGSVIVLRNN
jgi:hypothetical protein